MAQFTGWTDQLSGPLLTAAVGVSAERGKALADAGEEVPKARQIRALIDTGASCTCVDRGVLDALGLKPTGTAPVHVADDEDDPEDRDQYDVSLIIPGQQNQVPLVFGTIPVLSASLKSQGFQALIGRDILERCVLVYNGSMNQYTLAF